MRRVEGSNSRKSWALARWAVLPLAALALLAWVARSPQGQPPAEQPNDSNGLQAARPPSPVDVLPQSAARAVARPPQAGPSPAALARANAQKNAPAEADRKAFAADGWTMVDAPPPEPRLTALDPSLVRGREAELRTQLASTSASPDNVPNLVEIVSTPGAELQTRMLAIESLGRIGGDAAQEALLKLLDTLAVDDPARREVAPLLRPRSVDDQQAAALARRLDHPELTAVEKKQLAFTLALLGLRDGRALPGTVRDGLSAQARALLDQMTTLATTGAP